MLGVFALMVFPAGTDAAQDENLLWGSATIQHHDADGNILLSQTIHNRLLDVGESFIINQVFDDGTLNTETEELINVICVTQEASFTADAEGLTVATFDGADGITGSNCMTDVQVDNTTQGKAIIGPLTFDTGNLNAVGDTITGIGICQGITANNDDHATCVAGNAGSGILFAVIVVTDTTLNSGETVDITYTFDITSSGN